LVARGEAVLGETGTLSFLLATGEIGPEYGEVNCLLPAFGENKPEYFEVICPPEVGEAGPENNEPKSRLALTGITGAACGVTSSLFLAGEAKTLQYGAAVVFWLLGTQTGPQETSSTILCDFFECTSSEQPDGKSLSLLRKGPSFTVYGSSYCLDPKPWYSKRLSMSSS
jgi:hypothetical protein